MGGGFFGESKGTDACDGAENFLRLKGGGWLGSSSTFV